jgi:hypothetical protein
MNGAHVSGGALGAVLAAILSPLLTSWGLGTLPDSTYALIGSLGLAMGVGLGHVIATQGLWPALKRVFTGPPKEG